MENYREKFKEKSILITGGLGFIGSNLARKLLELEPKKIIIVDSLIKNLGGNPDNVAEVSSSLEIYNLDVSNQEAMEQIIKKNEIDYLFNLAGSVSHLDSKNILLSDLDLNLRTHVSLLENCRKYIKNEENKKLKVLFSSTRDTYGKARLEDLPIKENTFVWKESDPQGIHKHAAEFHHRWYATNFGFDTTVLRLTNTYGPRQNIREPNLGFLGYFIHQALKDENIALWGGGEPIRDFNYVDDVVEAMLMAMASEKTNGEIYNLGSYIRVGGKFEDIGNNIRTVGETAKIITKLAGSGKFEEIPYPEERKSIEPGHVYLDATKIYDHIGWKPKTSFEEGVNKTIQFYKGKKEYQK